MTAFYPCKANISVNDSVFEGTVTIQYTVDTDKIKCKTKFALIPQHTTLI